MPSPPSNAQVVVIGGGPAGSYCASVLAREGLDVVLLESAHFPRYHVGESLIPSIRHYLRFIDAEDKLVDAGFVRKPGSAIKFNQFKREGYTDFVALGHDNNSWNVTRSEFDLLLLNHARSCDVKVFEGTKVTAIGFDATSSNTTPAPDGTIDIGRPINVSWTQTTSSNTQTHGQTTYTHLVDASGRAGLLSTSHLKNRRFNESLKNIAVWGYWTDVGTYGMDTPREGAPWFEALTDHTGWAWFIPLNGTTSIGIVMNQKAHNEKCKSSLSPSPFTTSQVPSRAPSSKMLDRYLSNLTLAPGLVKLISSGKLTPGSVKSASDFSYAANRYGGDGYRIIGDAGAFIDPFFSSGIHLALTSGLSAASSICASIRGDCTEAQAAEWHTKRVATSYTRFQVVVMSAYKQIRAESTDILADVDEDNFDRAFTFLRPVIQGASDMGARLSESELQKSLDFCVKLFNPTSPEQHARVEAAAVGKNESFSKDGKPSDNKEDREVKRIGKLGKELLDVNARVIDPEVLARALMVGKDTTRAFVNEDDGDSDKENASDSMSTSTTSISTSFSSATTCFSSSISNASGDDDDDDDDETKLVLEKVNARRVIHSEYSINTLESEDLDGLVVRLERGRLGLVRIDEKGL